MLWKKGVPMFPSPSCRYRRSRVSRWLLRPQLRLVPVELVALGLLFGLVPFAQPASAQVQLPPNFLSPDVPHDVPAGSSAGIQDLAIFAWREFVALNWPSLDPATTGMRGRADVNASFFISKGADGTYPLLVWQTYRHKNELFPANGVTDPSFDSSIPKYLYKLQGAFNGPPGTLSPAQPGFTMNIFNNLDEASQIGLCTMFAHDSIKIAYEAKVSRAIFDYANATKLTACDDKGHCPTLVTARTNTKANLAKYGGICAPPAGTTDPVVTLPCGDASVAGDAGEGAIEIKAAWRALTPTERDSGRFFIRTVLFYSPSTKQYDTLYQNAAWGLVALHIIHKTKSFPDFVFASWEQVDNYDDVNNTNTEDLRFHNISGAPNPPPDIPVSRAHPIHSQIPPVNDAVHAAFKARDPATVWQYYKLIGVQGTPVNGPPPANSPIDDLSYYYLANIVVETNQALQNFFGKVANNGLPAPTQNVFFNGASVQMGGCQGCHGFQGQSIGGDMSRLIAVAPSNSTQQPETIDINEGEAAKSFLERSRDALQ